MRELLAYLTLLSASLASAAEEPRASLPWSTLEAEGGSFCSISVSAVLTEADKTNDNAVGACYIQFKDRFGFVPAERTLATNTPKRNTLSSLEFLFPDTADKVEGDTFHWSFQVRLPEPATELRACVTPWRKRDCCKGFKLFCQSKPVNAKSLDYRPVKFSPVREEYFDWVDRLHALASAHGAKLLLLTAPYDVSGFGDPLPQMKMAKSLHAYAKSRGIHFLDMNKQIEQLEFDTKSDFYDFGHLNANGAKKATRHIGRHLKSNFSIGRAAISKSERKSWEEDAVNYDKLYNVAIKNAKQAKQ